MRIFAKRGNKASLTVKDKKKVKDFQSDPVVEELLKQDPSTWKSKQRRMVKRYQDRQKEYADASNSGDTQSEALHSNEASIEQSDEEAKHDDSTGSDRDEKKPHPESGESSAESAVEENSGGEKDAEEETPCGDGAENEAEEQLGTQNAGDEKAADSQSCPPSSEGNPDSRSPKEQLDALLAELNSKERRKIARKIERTEATVDEAIQEAKSLLTEKATPQKQSTVETSASETTGDAAKDGQITDSSSKKRGGEVVSGDGSPSKKRRRKGPVDLSSLPPEERLRREEQRRLQKKTAEKIEKGLTNTKHRHPLNSERRRANRRKPKWLKRTGPKSS